MFKRSLSVVVILAFISNNFLCVPQAKAVTLPVPGAMVQLSKAYEPALIKGMTIHQDNPFLFDFIVDGGQDNIQGEVLKQQSDRMIKYFFASLTIPEQDIWVNLSPYERDRTVPTALGKTAMGRDLLAQDYILKQITASLIYPKSDLGKKFWDRVFAKAQQMYGPNVNVPVNTFNKVWIIADKAHVYEHGQTAWVTDGHLKVMLEEDYLASKKNGVETQNIASKKDVSAKQIIRELLIPEIEKEVNTGKNFATLRQIYNSLILASWYKQNMKQSILTQAYANKSTVNGIDSNKSTTNEAIYKQYLQAYKKGVFNLIKEDTSTSEPRKYFSGGFGARAGFVSQAMTASKTTPASEFHQAQVSVANSPNRSSLSKAMITATKNAEDISAVLLNLEALGIPENLIKDVAAYISGGAGTDNSVLYDTNSILHRLVDQLYPQSAEKAQWLLHAAWLSAAYGLNKEDLAYLKDHLDAIDTDAFRNLSEGSLKSEDKIKSISKVATLLWEYWQAEFEPSFQNLNDLKLIQLSTPIIEELNNFRQKQATALATIKANFDKGNELTLNNGTKVFEFPAWLSDDDSEQRRILEAKLKEMVLKYQGTIEIDYYADTVRSLVVHIAPEHVAAFKNELDAALPNADSAQVDLQEQNTRSGTPTGGIDLSRAQDGLVFEKDANGGVKITIDKAMMQRIQEQGIGRLVPTIINMRLMPATELPLLLGIAPKREDDEHLAQNLG